LFGGASLCQATPFPTLLRLQGRFTDTDKIPLTDNLPVRFSIWDAEDGTGNLLWDDIQNVSIQNNIFQVVLGRAKALPPAVFSGGDRWLELQIGDDLPLRPRHRIPSQYIQAQLAPAAVQPVVVPPPPPVVAPVQPSLTDQERKDLELQIDRYKEPTQEAPAAPVPVPAPKPAKKKHVKPIGEVQTPEGPVYNVQEGDTLESIAQKLYGNADLWYDLYYLNRDRLGPMGYLTPGQILVLPTKAPGEITK
jgi:LysM repeat protein